MIQQSTAVSRSLLHGGLPNTGVQETIDPICQTGVFSPIMWTHEHDADGKTRVLHTIVSVTAVILGKVWLAGTAPCALGQEMV